MSTLVGKRNELEAKNRALFQMLEQGKTEDGSIDVAKIDGLKIFATTAEKAAEIRRLNDELTALGKEVDGLVAVEKAAEDARKRDEESKRPATSFVHPTVAQSDEPRKSLGELIIEQKGKIVPGGPAVHIPFEAKTLFQTSAGWAPESMRLDRVELYPVRPIAVVDNIPQYTTDMAAVKYMEETTATFNAAEKAEAAAYAESAFAFTERSQTVEKVTTSIPITDEQWDDVPSVEEYLNNRLQYDIRRRLDLQVLEGTGATPLLLGTLNIGGSLQTQALGADPIPDACYKLFDKLRTVGFTEPSALFCNPSDWQAVALLRTADGIYIWGSPQSGGPSRMWGVPVVLTTAVTANTMIAGDYRGYSGLFIRSGIEVSMGYVNDDFTKGKKTLRAQMRCAMVHFRTSAFGTVTGV